MTPEQEKLVLKMLSRLHQGAVRPKLQSDGSSVFVCQYCQAAVAIGYLAELDHKDDCLCVLSEQLCATLPDEEKPHDWYLHLALMEKRAQEG